MSSYTSSPAFLGRVSIGKVRASTQTVMKGAIATIPQSEMTENPLRAGSRTSAIISARMSETLKAAEESNPLLGTENTWDEVEAYDDPGGSVRKEYLVNELILHETKKDIQKIHAEIGEEMEKNLNHNHFSTTAVSQPKTSSQPKSFLFCF